MKLRKDVYEIGKRKGKGQEISISNVFKKQNTGFLGNNNGQRQIPRCNICHKLGHVARECRAGTDQCYRCGKTGHMIKNYPNLERKNENTNNRGPVQRNNSQNYGYGRNASNIANRNLHLHSFISTAFSRSLNAKPCSEFSAMCVTIPNGESILYVMYSNCPILIGGCEFQVDLVRFELTDFDVILGMNWLSKYKTNINCLNHEITLMKPDGCKVSYRRRKVQPIPEIISSLKAFKLLSKGHCGYLCSVVDLTKPEPSLSDIPIVCEYPDVFQKEISGMPPEREIDFSIDLVPGSAPISKAPYRMAPAELQELKNN
ncbi:uncharacterized protein LOC125491863 [Beta vulgaris subsp. vulgaris]|uniref:uncharacterized protein LOC125491863 n=1 Tax=Beta vulgaris subsp. vulgaris TaxID=3555 RepID=UPI0025468CD9|nr:uncharacterized protein LOC125491863 [Beta vulgaris subsp. vulgaris]